MSEFTPQDIAWSRALFDKLNDGAIWAVPRSGLLFQRRGDKLVLVNRLGIALVPQQEDFDVIAAHFREAGVVVEDET